MSKIVFIPGFVATVTTIVIDNTPIIGGASGRILFENAANQISESANFTYLAGIFNVTKTATHQAQFTFDANNYFRIKATSTGATELSATGTAPKFLFNADVDAQTNKVYAAGIGVGTITPAAILEVLGTTAQARFSYNANNRLEVTISSNGNASFNLTGTAPKFNFFSNIGIGPTVYTSTSNASISVGRFTNSAITAEIFGNSSATNILQISNFVATVLVTISNTGVEIILPVSLRGAALVPGVGLAVQSVGTTFPALNVYALAAQTASITEFKNSGGTVLSEISALGKIGFGTAGTVVTPFHAISTTEQFRLGYNVLKYSSFTVGSTGSLTIGLTGTTPRTTFSQGIDVLGTIKLNGYTVATLPAGVIGETAYVTDALAPIFLGIIAGGGAVVTPVFYNGANWIAQ